MPSQILMPALSPTMEEGKLARWLVKEGDELSSGDVIAEIETDKATMEVEAVDEGILGKILIAEGTDNVKVNSVIAVILEEGEDHSSIDNMSSSDVQSPEAVQSPSDAPASSKSNETPLVPATIEVLGIADEDQEPEIPEGTEMITQTVREALLDAMAEEMRLDKTVFIMGEEVAQYQGAYKVTQGLLDEFGDKRVIDTPITECGFAGVGVGAAFGGLRPIVEFMTFNFAMLAVDHIINSAAKTLYMSGGQMRCPIVFRGPNGAASRVGAQHSQNFASWYANIPGLKVIAPHSAADAKGLMKAAIRDQNPIVFLENEIMYGKNFEVPNLDDFVLPIGKSRKVRNGSDVTIVGYSFAMEYILEALPGLIELGLNPEVIDLRTIRPIDINSLLKSLQKTNRLVVVDEGWPSCGIGAEVSALMMEHGFDYLDAPIQRVSGKDVPMPYAANLEKLALPSAKDVIDAVKSVCYI